MEARIYLAKEIEQTCITPPLRGNPPMLEVTNYSKTDVLADQNLIYSRGLTFQNTFLSYSRAPTTDTRKTKIVACWESNYYDVLTVSLKRIGTPANYQAHPRIHLFSHVWFISSAGRGLWDNLLDCLGICLVLISESWIKQVPQRCLGVPAWCPPDKCQNDITRQKYS